MSSLSQTIVQYTVSVLFSFRWLAKGYGPMVTSNLIVTLKSVDDSDAKVLWYRNNDLTSWSSYRSQKEFKINNTAASGCWDDRWILFWQSEEERETNSPSLELYLFEANQRRTIQSEFYWNVFKVKDCKNRKREILSPNTCCTLKLCLKLVGDNQI